MKKLICGHVVPVFGCKHCIERAKPEEPYEDEENENG